MEENEQSSPPIPDSVEGQIRALDGVISYSGATTGIQYAADYQPSITTFSSWPSQSSSDYTIYTGRAGLQSFDEAMKLYAQTGFAVMESATPVKKKFNFFENLTLIK